MAAATTVTAAAAVAAAAVAAAALCSDHFLIFLSQILFQVDGIGVENDGQERIDWLDNRLLTGENVSHSK